MISEKKLAPNLKYVKKKSIFSQENSIIIIIKTTTIEKK